MDPIRRNNFNPPVRPMEPARPAQPTQPASEAYDLHGPAGTQASQAGSAVPPQPNFDRLRARIEQALTSGRPKSEILNELVGGELREAFGGRTSAGMQQAVAETFKDDPQLMSLFNQLLGKAVAAAK